MTLYFLDRAIQYFSFTRPFDPANSSAGDNMRRSFWKTLAIPLIALAVGSLSIVLATEFIDESSFHASIQNKCTKSGADDPSLIPRPSANGKVRVIHLTNQGEFADRCEFTDVLDEIVWDHCPNPNGSIQPCFNPKLAIKEDAESKPKLIVLYVHGWMHSAADGDSNFERFKSLICGLASSDSHKQVLGIYITWNASTGNSVLDYASFWSRQRIADRITQSAVLAKIVGTIGNVRGGSGKRDHFVAIAHSFGARMLFAAVNAPLVMEVERAYPKLTGRHYEIVHGPADAVLLLNPAFEASRYTAIDGFMRNEEVFKPHQEPLTITVATDNDWATRTAFPVGQLLNFSHDERATTTLGNYEPYFTHALTKSDNTCTTDVTQLTEQFLASDLCLRRETTWHNEKRITKSTTKIDPFGWSIVQPQNQEFNPFLVVRTTKDVIDNHGGIWDAPFSDWIFQILKALDERGDRLSEGKH